MNQVMAPTDESFEVLLRQLGNGRRLPIETFYRLPELPDILQYHVIPGMYTTVEIIPFNDPCMTEGSMMLHDNCVDKPTPDNYTCEDQKKFEKCFFPFMTSALAAQWQGGFCQRTCERCSCAADSGIQCSKLVESDLIGSNGVAHSVNRVLFPPPVFSKADYANLTSIEITATTPIPGPLPGISAAPAPAGSFAAAATALAGTALPTALPATATNGNSAAAAAAGPANASSAAANPANPAAAANPAADTAAVTAVPQRKK
ncbi:hypothetical protein VOLCADRAFT_105189 [Volvox carteri f. nagariensis]|uniref:FAS1 domain-containing protein n=1 Tax=Volvox carteri f. nagariensis TaxID=3068 RepID=D8TZ46_VOLCA|nr:uncharacterized protein VOLCADRAFT_105189 [Volvox carteri f. nagariensis]EFJ47213.1 hypothetical protein VOLCADRAFT_105189 [Volvox carteri f. nagariensis]|eukprot:XP_002951762.1 hypothetical protein VOLCADRAFT_105189 [Volvox carteri f. nagariensis]